ncbi:LHFPL tetraspan subfamily member 3 protein-like [Babylonia areolata]|uniref:LHFPL tetraspan subfamily member 3 protein-like n=1 Tax=Babylonia areolata TaxID=304850 RepID=UPI003FD04708
MDVNRFNPETAKAYHFRYMREYRAVAVVWALLSIIWCILNVVSFVQPQWIGDTQESPGYGHMGVFQYCYPDSNKENYVCSGSFTDFDTILTDAFRACTFFVGVSALLMLFVVAALLLFFCFKKTAVFIFSGILQIFSALFMFLACVIYPVGWNHREVKLICGDGANEYRLGDCSIRWAYILAILGIFDAAVLAVLAFFLAAKRAKIEIYSTPGTMSKSELNGYSETMSKRSIPIQPQVVAVPGDGEGDRYSEYSHPASQRGGRSNQGFQL